MFDLGASELLLLVIVAVIVIGPKDLPLAMRTAGRWAGKIRRVSGHFRAGVDAMIREAELEEMEKKWREQNEAIMRGHPGGTEPGPNGEASASAEAALDQQAASSGETSDTRTESGKADEKPAEPQLPLTPP